MRIRTLLLLLLLLPGVTLGPGWSLRFCAEALLGGCCTEVSVASCCPGEGNTPPEHASGMDSACDRCCIFVTTLHEQPVPSQEPLANFVERTQAAALAIALPSADVQVARLAHECSTRAASGLPPAASDRCTPLPLRI